MIEDEPGAEKPIPEAEDVEVLHEPREKSPWKAFVLTGIDPEALTALQSAQADGFEWPDTSGLEDRLAALEITAKTSAAPTELSSEIMERIEALEAGVQTNSEIASEDSLSAEEDEDDPITLIESIEADIEQGRLEAAAETFNRLPDPVRAAGQAWYDSVKAK